MWEDFKYSTVWQKQKSLTRPISKPNKVVYIKLQKLHRFCLVNSMKRQRSLFYYLCLDLCRCWHGTGLSRHCVMRLSLPSCKLRLTPLALLSVFIWLVDMLRGWLGKESHYEHTACCEHQTVCAEVQKLAPQKHIDTDRSGPLRLTICLGRADIPSVLPSSGVCHCHRV